MKLARLFVITGLALLSALFVQTVSRAEDAKMKPIPQTIKGHPLDELISGYRYAKPETRAMQDDEFDNPASVWLAEGAELWSKVDGKAGKSCQTCHKDAATSMKGVGARYPVYNDKVGKIVNVEQRINLCRVNNMKAKAYKWESNALLGMTIFINAQSAGMPVKVDISGKVAPFFEKGKKFYYERRGQLDMACKHCHEDHPGEPLRMNILSQGQINGFPTYRLKWQKPGSAQRRFKGCNKQVRASTFKLGSDVYTNLELYVKWRGSGLPVETPAVRN